MNNKVKLCDISSIQSGPFGTQLHKNEYVSHGVPMLNAKNVGNGRILTNDVDYVTDEVCQRLPNYILKTGDILFGRAGTIDRHCYIDEAYDGAFQGTNGIRIRCNDVSIAKYVSYFLWLPNVKHGIELKTGGSIQSYMTTDLLKDVEVVLPDADTISSVSNFLTTLEEKETNNTSICTNMEKVVKLIYDYWFVQFDFPDQNGKPYKTSGGAMEWNNELKREIPKGWKVKKILDLASAGKDCPYTSPKCVPTFDLSVMPSNSMLLAEFNESTNFGTNLFELKRGDILFGSIRPYLRKAGIAPCDGAVAGTVHVIRPKRKEDYNFLATTLCSERMFKYATTVSQGTKMPVVTLDSLFDYKIAYDEIVAEKFNGLDIMGIFSRIAVENHELAALRDFLLPMLMNGQVKIKADNTNDVCNYLDHVNSCPEAEETPDA